MAYKTILASLNEVAQLQSVLGAAAAVAREDAAHVIGLYVIPAVEIQVTSEIPVLPVENDEYQKYYRQHEQAARSAFQKIILDDGVHGEFHVIEAHSPHIAGTIIEEAREADLVIAGYSSSNSSRALGSDFSERLCIESGRPTLIMPVTEHNQSCAFDRILIGWNGSREAARAIFDSMPLLERAEDVLVAFACAEQDRQPRTKARREALVRTLLRHGVQARGIDLDSSREAGSVLIGRAETRAIDLIVMGAYGHARLREFILGGATRSVFKGMKCPVLFSH
jgi:nucleotide-binding universal stress UspA family protein